MLRVELEQPPIGGAANAGDRADGNHKQRGSRSLTTTSAGGWTAPCLHKLSLASPTHSQTD